MTKPDFYSELLTVAQGLPNMSVEVQASFCTAYALMKLSASIDAHGMNVLAAVQGLSSSVGAISPLPAKLEISIPDPISAYTASVKANKLTDL